MTIPMVQTSLFDFLCSLFPASLPVRLLEHRQTVFHLRYLFFSSATIYRNVDKKL